jgi:hypothetical protein
MAFTVDVHPRVLEESQTLASSVNLGRRGDGSDGTPEQQLVGILGQNTINFAIGRKFMRPSSRHDGGVDFELFGLTFDVKTMTRAVDPKLEYVNNLIASQVAFDVDAYLFLSFNRASNRITVCGWLPKDDFLARAKLYAAGQTRHRNDGTSFEMKADTFEIPNAALYSTATSWPELFVQISTYAQFRQLTRRTGTR